MRGAAKSLAAPPITKIDDTTIAYPNTIANIEEIFVFSSSSQENEYESA